MSDPSETGGRPLASNIQQAEAISQPPSLRRKRNTSQSSDERVAATKSSSPRRRPGSRKEASGPHTGSSRASGSTMQRSTSPTQVSPAMSSVNFTRTGRVSKAKKGLKVHDCECGRSYTRAEHLRRHQKNHAPTPLVCELPGCGKTFYRLDLLQRHQERHNEGDNDGRRPSYLSDGPVPDPETQASAPASLPTPTITALPQQPSSYYPQEASPRPEATSPPSHLKQRPFGAPSHQASVAMSVHVEGGLPTVIPWHDPFSPSPNYSSSSGYASPVPGTADYANMFANHPYASGSNRTRTSSNASYIEPWGYPSQSPTSATSTMAYTWSSNDKMAPASLAYMNGSYPLTSMPIPADVDPMLGFGGQFDPKSMAHRDEEEQAFLFPEQFSGMDQIAAFEQYLDNFWRLFHPSFPVVHRSTFERLNQAPMLRAAILAIGAQYSSDPAAKRKSQALHDRCMKLLDKRDLDIMTEPERHCDYQALFLIEVLFQYRARRAARSLSPRFLRMYQLLSQESTAVAARMTKIKPTLVHPENTNNDLWTQWLELCGQQRLFQCCYVLQYQQAVLLARPPQPSTFHYSGYDLPFPIHSALWNAEDSADWALAAQQYDHFPSYVCEVTPEMDIGPFDQFQSLLLIAAQYNHFSNPAIYLCPSSIPPLEHLIHDSPTTKHALLIAQLLQVVPIRALLAVAGETWILSEKVPTHSAFSNYKSIMKVWLNGLWDTSTEQQFPAVKHALILSIELLQQAITMPAESLHFEVGADIGLHFAVLVIWAVTVTSKTRVDPFQASPQPIRLRSQSPVSPNHIDFPLSPAHFSNDLGYPLQTLNPIHPLTVSLLPDSLTSPASPVQPAIMLHSEHTTTSINFLLNALPEAHCIGLDSHWPRDVSYWQRGCAALIRWVKMRLRNSASQERDSVIEAGPTSGAIGYGRESYGEVLGGVITVLEKILGHGWEGWGI